jgi:hypothetical protein
MLCAIDGSVLFPFLALARLVPRLTSRFLRALAFLGFGRFYLLLHSSVLAAEVTIAWDPAQDPNLARYRLDDGYAGWSDEGILDVGMETTYTFTDLEEGQPYYFTLVAYDIRGEESELSREVEHNGPV